jgi:predicted RNA-binding Zn ribbon-like protein
MDLIGGHIALDFMNTVGNHLAQTRDEGLTSYADLAAWVGQAGVIDGDHAARLKNLADAQPESAVDALQRATTVREVIYRLLLGVIRQESPDVADVAAFNRALADAPARTQIMAADGHYHWQWSTEVDSLDDPLWRVVWAAADLLTSDQMAQVKVCEGDECGWVFLDTSRNQARRWCSMADCGNRAKANRYYKKHKGE